jgi:MFS family permease
MAQFLSKRYDIELSKTGYVQSSYGVAQIIHALVILPWFSRFLMKDSTPRRLRAPDEQRRDLSLARASYGLLLAGFIVLGLAPALPAFMFGLFILALGSGYGSFTKTLMSLHVDPEHRSRLFSLIGSKLAHNAVHSSNLCPALTEWRRPLCATE